MLLGVNTAYTAFPYPRQVYYKARSCCWVSILPTQHFPGTGRYITRLGLVAGCQYCLYSISMVYITRLGLVVMSWVSILPIQHFPGVYYKARSCCWVSILPTQHFPGTGRYITRLGLVAGCQYCLYSISLVYITRLGLVVMSWVSILPIQHFPGVYYKARSCCIELGVNTAYTAFPWCIL